MNKKRCGLSALSARSGEEISAAAGFQPVGNEKEEHGMVLFKGKPLLSTVRFLPLCGRALIDEISVPP
ncbi:hypothetical protein [Paenibacillus humicus]|uniref:hypothetical protein n=1 Tax=Paenibacillus humicus TaxID=412861 RepID=UPI001C3F6004|nr:hypothetical protein [Paenibacillus humicus]